jgi:hypothetical protein
MKNIKQTFISLLKQSGEQKGFSCRDSIWSNNIIELYGTINCYVYFKIRSESPPRWGITKTRIEELKHSRKKWVIVLLYETHHRGYVLKSTDVEKYIEHRLWPLGNSRNRNEYKVSAPECKGGVSKSLQYNKQFLFFDDFLAVLADLS